MKYISKQDYRKLGKRINVHTTVREDLYEQLQILAVTMKEPVTKLMDVLIDNTINDKEKLSEFKNKVKLYK